MKALIFILAAGFTALPYFAGANEEKQPELHRIYDQDIKTVTKKIVFDLPDNKQLVRTVKGHYHPNGGGFVANTAYVSPLSYVGKDAMVLDQAWVEGPVKITGASRIYDQAVVYGLAEISGFAHVGGKAQVYGKAKIDKNGKVYGFAHVFDQALVTGNSRVFDYAQVFGDALIKDSASIFDYAHVFGKANVFGSAQVFGHAELWHYAQVGGDTEVFDTVRVLDKAKAVGKSISILGAGHYGQTFVAEDNTYYSGYGNRSYDDNNKTKYKEDSGWMLYDHKHEIGNIIGLDMIAEQVDELSRCQKAFRHHTPRPQ